MLRVAHNRWDSYTRVRVFFAAEPVGDPTPHGAWNGDPVGGAWLTLDEAQARLMRAPEAVALCEAVAGAPACPLRASPQTMVEHSAGPGAECKERSRRNTRRYVER